MIILPSLIKMSLVKNLLKLQAADLLSKLDQKIGNLVSEHDKQILTVWNVHTCIKVFNVYFLLNSCTKLATNSNQQTQLQICT